MTEAQILFGDSSVLAEIRMECLLNKIQVRYGGANVVGTSCYFILMLSDDMLLCENYPYVTERGQICVHIA